MTLPVADRVIEITGAGRLVSNVSPHSSQEGSFTSLLDAFVDRAQRIRKRAGTEIVGAAAGTPVRAIHEYIYVSATTGTETQYLMRHTGAAIDRYSGGAWAAMTLPAARAATGLGVFVNAENRCFFVDGDGEMLVLDAAIDSTWRNVGLVAPTITPTYTLGGTYTTGTVSCTKGSPTVTGVVPAIWSNVTMPGKFIDINGARYTISTVDVLGDGGGVAPVLTLTEGFKEDTAAGMSYAIYIGLMTWVEPPVYAYSYYNPTTGHVSNRSPLCELSQKNQTNRTPTITIAGSATHTTAYNLGYTRLVIYRTQKDAGVLTAILATVDGSTPVANNNTGAAIVFTESSTTYADTHLSFYDAPIGNTKPVARIAYLAYCQGRLHGATKEGKHYFSAVPEEIGNFGVANYCWPARFERNITLPRGLVLLGGDGGETQLIAQTAQGDYVLGGYDNRTFEWYLLPNRRSGSYQYGASSVDGQLVTFYADKRFMVGGRNDLGLPIQDRLNAALPLYASNARTHWYAAGERNIIALSLTLAGTANSATMMFDLDEEAWGEWRQGYGAFATVHNPTTGALELWAGQGNGVYRLYGTVWQDSGANFQPELKTSILRPFGSEGGAQVAWVKIYASESANLPTVKVFIHEQPSSAAVDGTAITGTMKVADHRVQGAQNRELLWTPSTAIRRYSTAFQVHVTFPAVNSDYYIDKIVVGFMSAGQIQKA